MRSRPAKGWRWAQGSASPAEWAAHERLLAADRAEQAREDAAAAARAPELIRRYGIVLGAQPGTIEVRDLAAVAEDSGGGLLAQSVLAEIRAAKPEILRILKSR